MSAAICLFDINNERKQNADWMIASPTFRIEKSVTPCLPSEQMISSLKKINSPIDEITIVRMKVVSIVFKIIFGAIKDCLLWRFLSFEMLPNNLGVCNGWVFLNPPNHYAQISCLKNLSSSLNYISSYHPLVKLGAIGSNM